MLVWNFFIILHLISRQAACLSCENSVSPQKFICETDSSNVGKGAERFRQEAADKFMRDDSDGFHTCLDSTYLA